METIKADQNKADQNKAGQDQAGQDHTGQDHTGQDQAGQDHTGQDQAGWNQVDQIQVDQIQVDRNRVNQIIDKHNGEPSNLLQILLDIQSENSWLPREALIRVSEKLDVPMTRIQHITTFYKAFSLVPKGRHKVHICVGTACHVRGATRILDTVEESTGVKPGETDLDMKFSVETVNCLGCCALGPVMEVDGKVHGKMSPVKTTKALETYE